LKDDGCADIVFFLIVVLFALDYDYDYVYSGALLVVALMILWMRRWLDIPRLD
jgi:hypothetical protein